MNNPHNESDTAARFSHIETAYSYHKVDREERISVDELPVFIRLGHQAVDQLVIVNPAVDLTPSEQAARSDEGQGRYLNPSITTFIINPTTYSIDQGAGYKALREGEAVTLGRSHQNELPRFAPFSAHVSREHATIQKTTDGQSIVIRDLGSMNGTFIGKLALGASDEAITATIPYSTEAEPSREQSPVERAYGSTIASAEHPERNDDSLLIDEAHRLYAVFDGVGGRSGGNLASETARDFIAAQAINLEGLDDPVAVNEHLLKMLDTAHRAVMTYAPASATTAVLAKLSHIGSSIYLSVAHIGDSRAYLMRNGALVTLTTDHTPFRAEAGTGEAMRQQERLAATDSLDALSLDDRSAFDRRNRIEGYLGTGNRIRPDVKHFSVQPGDEVILTSDGIHDNLTAKEIEHLLTTATSLNRAELLTATAYRRANDAHDRAKMDDMTAVIINV